MKDDPKLRLLLSRNVNNVITEQLIEEIVTEYAANNISSQEHGPTEGRIPASSDVNGSVPPGGIHEISLYSRGEIKNVGSCINRTIAGIDRNIVGDR